MAQDVFGQGQAQQEDAVPVEQLGYEDARDELVETVKLLEMGQLSLDESLALWERGEALAKRCEEQLAGAKERVERALEQSSSPE